MKGLKHKTKETHLRPDISITDIKIHLKEKADKHKPRYNFFESKKRVKK